VLRIPRGELPTQTQSYLDGQQGKIDELTDYLDRVRTAKALWDSKTNSKKGKERFDEVRNSLERLCPGARRCHYCEDSAADEIEHIWPKNFYPDRVFRWGNYLYACGPCNGSSKGDRFAVFDEREERVDLVRGKKGPAVAPSASNAVFADPRREDPMDYLDLDLYTGIFIPRSPEDSREHLRAKYTIEVLKLNARDYLTHARRSAYRTYLDSLRQYVSDKQGGATEDELAAKRREIEGRHHPTVWREMIRIRHRVPGLAALFAEALELT
jgi:uncharacterized protein (TIGR02646 family)